MTEFESVLQACLHDVETGALSVDECLQHHPKHARELEPILLASAYLARGREARISPAFKSRVRIRLVRQMYAHPRKPARTISYGWMRLAASLAAVTLAILVAGTVYAQRALPGEAFYRWKITSENAWRMVSPDPVGTDLALAERRFNELIVVRNDPVLQAQTLDAYLQLTDRLRSQVDATNETRIQEILQSQAEELNQLEILPEETIPSVAPQLAVPTVTPTPHPTRTPLPILETAPVDPTELPQIVPTVEVVPGVLPTVQDPPKILPTLEIPAPIP